MARGPVVCPRGPGGPPSGTGNRHCPHEGIRNGSITLTFSEHPLELRKWVVLDAQGLETGVTLLNARFGGSLDEDLFDVTDPISDEAEGE